METYHLFLDHPAVSRRCCRCQDGEVRYTTQPRQLDGKLIDEFLFNVIKIISMSFRNSRILKVEEFSWGLLAPILRGMVAILTPDVNACKGTQAEGNVD